VEGGRG